MNLKICYLKIYVSCEASVNFQHISQNATPATQFAPCRHLTQPWQSIRKTRNTTHLKCCACHAKWRWRSPKCCACHEKSNSSSWHDAKVLRLPHKKTVNTLWKMLDCHEVPGLPRETKLRGIGNHQSDHFCRTCHMHGHTGLTQPPANSCGWLRTVSDGCDRKRNVKRTHPQPRDPQSETGTLATHSGIRRITTMSTPSHSIHHGRFLQARNPHTLASRDQNCSTTMWLLEVLWLLNNCTQHNKQKCSENIFWTGQEVSMLCTWSRWRLSRAAKRGCVLWWQYPQASPMWQLPLAKRMHGRAHRKGWPRLPWISAWRTGVAEDVAAAESHFCASSSCDASCRPISVFMSASAAMVSVAAMSGRIGSSGPVFVGSSSAATDSTSSASTGTAATGCCTGATLINPVKIWVLCHSSAT